MEKRWRGGIRGGDCDVDGVAEGARREDWMGGLLDVEGAAVGVDNFDAGALGWR